MLVRLVRKHRAVRVTLRVVFIIGTAGLVLVVSVLALTTVKEHR